MARWNGLKILIPKHMWKSKIGLLEQIWGQNPYDTFFLGHPVHNLATIGTVAGVSDNFLIFWAALLEYIVHHPLTTTCVKQDKIVKRDGACHNFSCFDISITHHGHPHCNHRHHHIPPHHNQLLHHWSPSHSFKNWKLLSSCLLELPAFDFCFSAFLHCVFSNESSNRLPEQMQSHIDCTYLTLCIFKCVFKLSAREDA